MLRTCLFLILASVAGAATAQTQVTDDPQAVAPVQYDDGSAAPMDCGLDDNGRPLPCPNDSQYTSDDPDVDEAYVDSAFVPDYYAYQDYEYYPPYYAGVSLWPPYDYWPGYAWGGWGFGWPYVGFDIGFGFGWHHGYHHGWDHGRYAWHDHYHGPWRDDGHGHYWDHHGSYARNDRSFHGRENNGHMDNRAGHDFAGRSSANFGTNRSMSNARSFGRGVNEGRTTAFRSNDMRGASFGANRAPLRSASYYSAGRGVQNGRTFNRTQTFNRGDFNSNVRGGSPNGRATGYGLNSNPHVASMPNRGYSTQGYRSGSNANRSYTATLQRSGLMGSQQRYSGGASRGGSYGGASHGGYANYGGRSASYARPNYSGRSYSAPRASRSYSSGGHSSGGHSSGAYSSGGRSGGHDDGGHRH